MTQRRHEQYRKDQERVNYIQNIWQNKLQWWQHDYRMKFQVFHQNILFTNISKARKYSSSKRIS